MAKPPPDDPKIRSLRGQATLNPRPQAVTDELFLEDEFFDPRDLVQVKYEMVRRVERDGHTVTDAAARFGFSRPSFYHARTALEDGGLAGLVPHKRGPRRAHKLTDEILEFMRQTLEEDPSLRSRDLMMRIRERFGVEIHPRTIERGLARSQKKRRQP